MSPMKLVGSEALSTAFSPLTPTAPAADVLMLSQPAPGQLTDGSAELAALSAALPAAARWRWKLGGRRARGRGTLAPARRLAAVWLGDAEDAVDDVVDGPLSKEQPPVQPVAAGPANVGVNCPRLDVLTEPAWAPVALPVPATQKAPSSTTGSDSNDSMTNRLRMILVRIAQSPPHEQTPAKPRRRSQICLFTSTYPHRNGGVNTCVP
jgi:hypothetical protein